jgi:hypothetical protein
MSKIHANSCLEDLKGMNHFGKYKNWCEGNIKIPVKEVQCKGIDWVHLAQERVKWQAVVHTVINLQQPLKMGDFLTSLLNVVFFKDSFTCRWLNVAAAIMVFIFNFLFLYSYFLCFYFVFFNSLSCVLFLTEPHASIYLILCLKRYKCCYWFHSTLILVEVSVQWNVWGFCG